VNQEIYKRVRNNPKFSELVKKRSGLAWKLSAIIFVAYYSFIMLIAFSPETLGRPIGDGVTTVGIPVGISIILLSIILTGIYIKRANNEFDKLIDDIRDDVRFDS
jgi:uncharacterized membrane protein (DUF485 family)